MRHALQRIVDDDREMIARRHVLAGKDHVAPGLRRGSDSPVSPAGPLPGFAPAQRASLRDCLPPCRDAAHRARRPPSASCARHRSSRGGCRDKAVRHPDRAASLRRAPPPERRYRLGSRSSDRPDLAPAVAPAHRDRRRNARTAAAPAVSHPMPSQARSSWIAPRIPAGSACGRCPRSAAAVARLLSRAISAFSSADSAWPRCR